MADEPIAQTRQPYRLTERSFFGGLIQAAGTVLHLLPHEATPTMEKLAIEDLLVTSLRGAVCQAVTSPIAGFLPLNLQGQVGAPHRVAFDRPRRLRLSATSDLSGIILMLFGVDEEGAPFISQPRGPGSAEVPYTETEKEFAIVTGVMASGPVTGLTIDGLETPEEKTARLDAQSDRRRLLWEKTPRTAAEAAEIVELLARREALAGMPKRSPDEEEELSRLVADLPASPAPAPDAAIQAEPAPEPAPVSHETASELRNSPAELPNSASEPPNPQPAAAADPSGDAKPE